MSPKMYSRQPEMRLDDVPLTQTHRLAQFIPLAYKPTIRRHSDSPLASIPVLFRTPSDHFNYAGKNEYLRRPIPTWQPSNAYISICIPEFYWES